MTRHDPAPRGHPSAAIRLDHVTKRFPGGVVAVDQVDLTVDAGEFFSLLGPSGCGKTTTLRMIAGFEVPDEGAIRVGDRDLTHVPVHHRGMGMVFQSYALFPHRTVAENVAFGLRMRGFPRPEIAERVRAALAEQPGLLSGGVDVEATSGTVYLRGQVSGVEAIDELERRARAVPGVDAVRSRLSLTGNPPPGTGQGR